MSGKVPLHDTWEADLTRFDPEPDDVLDPETDAAWDLGWDKGAIDLDPPAVVDVPAVPVRPTIVDVTAVPVPPAIPDPHNAQAADFRVDRYDRAIVNPPVSRLRRFMRTIILLAMLAGGASLVWEHGADWYRYAQEHGPAWYALLEPEKPAPSQPEPQITAPDRILDTKTDDPTSGMAMNPPLESLPEPAAKPEQAALPASPPPAEAKTETEEPPEAQAAAASGADIKRIAAPETEPETIPGWKLREVIGETVVLEGPGGIRKAKRGETVPGLGQVQSVVLWGKHLLVATSRGLVGTR